MSAFKEIFGEQLLTKDGLQSTETLLGDKDAVALYFSAHWCPPCRGFTPKLAEKYNNIYKEKKMEIIFVSSDRDQDSFEDYYKEHPWLALPYSERDLKNTLSKKYKVSGIPTLVILNPDGEVITKDGRSKIEDPDSFPWTPKPISELLQGPFVGKDGSTITKDALEGKYLGIYFSAHWCPPCKKFTPQLAKTYNKLQENKQPFEVIFVSSDKKEEEFKGYFDEMPWIALPYSERKTKDALSSFFEVDGIPSFVILDTDHKTIINQNARGAISGDPEGEKFPWIPPTVRELDVDDVDGIDEDLSFISVCENLDDGGKKKIKEHLQTLHKKLKAADKENSNPTHVNFYVSNKSDGQVYTQIKNLVGEDIFSGASGILLDISDNGGYYVMKDELTAASVENFITKKKNNELERHQLKQ